MAMDRIAQALARIEVASKRIESAAVRAGPVGDGEWEQRYSTLEREATAALHDLDRLIEALEP